MSLHNALIRTHHITSRRKIYTLRNAAKKYGCYVLLRSGGCPGVMYVEGTDEGVKSWVGVVRVSTVAVVLSPMSLPHFD